MKTPAELPNFDAVREALASYCRARHQLRELGVLRSDRSVHGDFAEWLVCQMLGFQIAASGVQKGFDAKDGAGNTYQVKARIVKSLEQPTSFDMKEPGHPFDFLIGVFLTESADVLGIIRVPYQEVLARARVNMGRRSFRWTKAMLGETWVEFLYRR
jgi:hypothetical protein